MNSDDEGPSPPDFVSFPTIPDPELDNTKTFSRMLSKTLRKVTNASIYKNETEKDDKSINKDTDKRESPKKELPISNLVKTDERSLRLAHAHRVATNNTSTFMASATVERGGPPLRKKGSALSNRISSMFNNLPNDIELSEDSASDSETIRNTTRDTESDVVDRDTRDDVLEDEPSRPMEPIIPDDNTLPDMATAEHIAPHKSDTVFMRETKQQSEPYVLPKTRRARNYDDFSLYSESTAKSSPVKAELRRTYSNSSNADSPSLSSFYALKSKDVRKKPSNLSAVLFDKTRKKRKPRTSDNPLKNGGIPRMYWMNDAFVSDCLNCFKPFTAFRRKHHCRFCGQIFCADCTLFISYNQHKAEKTHVASQTRYSDKLRVCKPCYSDVIVYLSDNSSEEEEDKSENKEPEPSNEPKEMSDIEELIPPVPSGAWKLAIPTTRTGEAVEIPAKGHTNTNIRTISKRYPSTPDKKWYQLRNYDESLLRSASSSRMRIIEDVPDDPYDSDQKNSDESHEDEQAMSLYTLLNVNTSPKPQMPTLGEFPTMYDHDEHDFSFRKEEEDAPFFLHEEPPKSESLRSRERAHASIQRMRSRRRQRNPWHRVPTLKREKEEREKEEREKEEKEKEEKEMGIEEKETGRGIEVIKGAMKEGIGGIKEGIGGERTTGADEGIEEIGVDEDRPRIMSDSNESDEPSDLWDSFEAHLDRILSQSLEDSEVEQKDRWTRVLKKVLSHVQQIKLTDTLDIRQYIKIKRNLGGRIEETAVINGMYMTKNIDSKRMRRRIERPKIALLMFPIEYLKQKEQFISLRIVHSQQSVYISNLVSRLVSLEPDIIVVGDSVCGLAEQLLEDAGITVMSNVKPQVIERISRYTKADIFQGVNDLFFKKGNLGTCDRFEVCKFLYQGTIKTYSFFVGTDFEAGFTISLRGGSEDLLSAVKYAAETLVPGYLNAKLEMGLAENHNLHFEKAANPNLERVNARVAQIAANAPTSLEPMSRDVVEYIQLFNQRVLSLSPGVHFPLPTQVLNVVDAYLEYQTFAIKNMQIQSSDEVTVKKEWLEEMEESIGKREKREEKEEKEEKEKEKEEIKEVKEQDVEDEENNSNGDVRVSKLLPAAEITSPVKSNLKDLLNRKAADELPKSDLLVFLKHTSSAQLQRLSEQYHARLRAWVNVSGFPSYQLYPNFHRSLHVLHSTVSIKHATPCSGPNTVIIDYYTDNDKSIGQLLDQIYHDSQKTCEECGDSLLEHYKTYVHGNAKVDLITARLEGHKNQRAIWSYCKVCQYTAPPVAMREETYFYSIGKFLELCFYGGGMRSGCPHDFFAHHVRCFGMNDLVVRLEYSKIDTYEVVVPRKQLYFRPEVDMRLKVEAHNNIQAKAERFFASVSTRLNRVKLDTYDKADQGLERLRQLKAKVSAETDQIAAMLADIYASSAPTEYLAMNAVLRKLQDLGVGWDDDFRDFEERFLPSEHEITKITQFHLRSFLDKYDKKEKKPEQEQEQEEQEPEPVEEASPPPDSSSSSNSPDGTADLSQSLNREKTNEIGRMIPSSLYSTSNILERINRIEQLMEKESEDFRKLPPPAPLRHLTGKTSESSLNEPNKVVQLASLFNKMNIDRISREFEKQRVQEMQKKSQYKAMPIVESKPIVEIYDKIEDVVGNEKEKKSKEEKVEKRDVSADVHVDSAPVDVPVDVSVPFSVDSASQSPQAVKPKKGDIPQTEKTSLLKSLTNFWADRSATLWDPLSYPLDSHEHTFADSDVIVREDEPSSLVAFCLSSADYKQKIKAMSESDDWETGFDLEKNEVNVKKINNFVKLEKKFKKAAHNGVYERIMNKNKSNHLKYQFEDGPTTLSCKIFYSEQFEAFRKACGTSENFIQSLSRCIKWNSSGGKSGSNFLKTLDNRYIVKELSRSELDSFVSIAPFYFKYISQSMFNTLSTAIAKIFGFYQIHIKNNISGKVYRMDFLIMENLFYNNKTSRIFDLKGSMRNRHVQQTGKENEVLLDENMIEYIYESPVFVKEHSKKLLRGSLFNDTAFLSAMDVMDYSLVVGIDDESKKLYIGIIDWLRTFTWDKKVENWVKGNNLIGKKGKDPTIVTPKQYRTRFREAMERYLLEVPDVWYEGSKRAQ